MVTKGRLNQKKGGGGGISKWLESFVVLLLTLPPPLPRFSGSLEESAPSPPMPQPSSRMYDSLIRSGSYQGTDARPEEQRALPGNQGRWGTSRSLLGQKTHLKPRGKVDCGRCFRLAPDSVLATSLWGRYHQHYPVLQMGKLRWLGKGKCSWPARLLITTSQRLQTYAHLKANNSDHNC